jgi:hypothetical protein
MDTVASTSPPGYLVAGYLVAGYRCLLWLVNLLVLWSLTSGLAQAGEIADRLTAFPNWQGKPPVQVARGDLTYPDWFAGNWTVTTTLVDLVAPLAPEIITPGFEDNRRYLEKPISFQVRFVETLPQTNTSLLPPTRIQLRKQLVSDRAFNGLNLARAYLGDRTILAVKVDPHNPNRQITLLRGDRQLVSTVTGRLVEAPTPDQFLTTEVFQQEFRGTPRLYFNQVETTTNYHYQGDRTPTIVADQVTAIYLSPQDPTYFQAGDRPVALYRYRLEFFPNTGD